MNSISIKRASLSDINEIATMQVRAWSSDDLNIAPEFKLQHLFINALIKKWQEQFENHTHTLILLENDKIVGFISYIINIPKNLTHFTPDVEILNLYVVPTMRRQGFGKMLLESLLNEAKQMHSNRVIVWISKEDNQTQLFYENLNFYPTFTIAPHTTKHDQFNPIQYLFSW